MATQRIKSPEKTNLDQDDITSEAKSNISPAVPTSVIVKLLGFTLAMVVLPIGSYFASINILYGGNSTYAGATAAAVANVVLMGYVVVAFQDDKAEREEEAKKSN